MSLNAGSERKEGKGGGGEGLHGAGPFRRDCHSKSVRKILPTPHHCCDSAVSMVVVLAVVVMSCWLGVHANIG
jgi:hypothetical protein